MAEVLIPDLEQGDGNPTIIVRVSRLCEYRDQNDETIVHNISLVLLDKKVPSRNSSANCYPYINVFSLSNSKSKQGASIVAYIYPPLDVVFGPIITEGKVYRLTFYRVRPCSRNYRPVNNRMSINFTKWTTLEEHLDVPADFPCYAYSPTPYNELRSHVDRKDSFTGTIIPTPLFLMIDCSSLHIGILCFLIWSFCDRCYWSHYWGVISDNCSEKDQGWWQPKEECLHPQHRVSASPHLFLNILTPFI